MGQDALVNSNIIVIHESYLILGRPPYNFVVHQLE